MSINTRWLAALLALASGAVAYFVPSLVSDSESCRGVNLLFVSLGTTVALPLVFGFWQPHRAWVWGFYVLAGQLVFQFIEGWGGDMNQFPLGVVLYAVLSIPTVLTGIIGATLSKSFCHRST